MDWQTGNAQYKDAQRDYRTRHRKNCSLMKCTKWTDRIRQCPAIHIGC
jgi:hypothetical protein